MTTSGWLQSEGANRRADVAILKLDSPFLGHLSNFSYVDTPISGSYPIGVTGYPFDKPDGDGVEKGPQMWDCLPLNGIGTLKQTSDRCLRQSGSPVIRTSDIALIEVHTHGGREVNPASSIYGKYSNDFKALIHYIKETTPSVGHLQGLNVFQPLTARPGGREDKAAETFGNSTETSIAHESRTSGIRTEDMFDFLDVLKDVVK
ncbi:hypothetical protein B0J14DRAFT_697933 [Halenospora varia]|nr:hypothetical protein B0J14DRAFT_697933 [Halenospora varia]